MPIKPENKAHYPANWDALRELILIRAGNCCEKCKAPNGVKIARGAGDDVDTYMLDDGKVLDSETGEYLGYTRMSEWHLGKMVKIVLTIAHLDHTPENNDPSNLRAWCQRCHLRYDAKHHAETARETRRNRLAMGDLFSHCGAN